jgi:hypothetical protein
MLCEKMNRISPSNQPVDPGVVVAPSEADEMPGIATLEP